MACPVTALPNSGRAVVSGCDVWWHTYIRLLVSKSMGWRMASAQYEWHE